MEKMNGDARPASNGQTRIMIDDDEPPPAANGHAQTNGSDAKLGVHLDERTDSRNDGLQMA